MTQQITAVCPTALLDDTEHFAMVIGGGPAHAGTFRNLNYLLPGTSVDAEGTGTCVVSNFPAGQWRVDLAMGTLERPDWDDDPDNYLVNMTAANRVQDAMVIWWPGKVDGEVTEVEPPQAEPDKLTVYVGVDPHQALALMGVARVDAATDP